MTGGAGTGKTVTALHRAAFLAGRDDQPAPAGQHDAPGPPILLTTFTRNLADSLDAQLSLLIEADKVRGKVEVVNVDRLAYRIVTQARGASPAIADHQQLRDRWAAARPPKPALTFTPNSCSTNGSRSSSPRICTPSRPTWRACGPGGAARSARPSAARSGGRPAGRR